MSDARFFQEPHSDKNEAGFIAVSTGPRYKLIDEQTDSILEKFNAIKDIVDEVDSAARLGAQYRHNTFNYGDYKSKLFKYQRLLTDLLNNLSIYSTVVDQHPVIRRHMEFFSSYSFYLKAIIAQIDEHGRYDKKEDIEKNTKDIITIFEMSIKTAAADAKKEIASRALKEYSETLNPPPPAPTKSKRKGGCTIL